MTATGSHRSTSHRLWVLASLGLVATTICACGDAGLAPTVNTAVPVVVRADLVDAGLLGETDGGTLEVGVLDERDAADVLRVPISDAAAASSGPEDAPRPPVATTDDGAFDVRPELVDLNPAEALRFEAVETGDLADHRIDMVFPGLGFHTGLGLHDVDRDGDLDLFVGASVDPAGDPACIYRNDSSPGTVHFTRVTSWCVDRAYVVTSVAFLPGDDDAPTRMLLTGRDTWAIATLDDRLRIEPFTVDRIDADASCDAAPNLLFDADLDGDLEAWIGCQGGLGSGADGLGRAFDLVLDLSEAPPTRVPVDGLPELSEASITLGTASLDLNDDGLLDLVTVVDTLSTPRGRNTLLPPGGTRVRCRPGDGCAWRAEPMLDTPAAWGSFMGITPWRLGEREVFYLTDFGPNRVIDLAADVRADVAPAIGADVYDQRFFAFSWSAIPGDFDGDGDDDLYVTQGSLPPLDAAHFARHFDVLLTQSEGRVVPFSPSVGIPLHTDGAVDRPEGAMSHRNGWRADLDGDGYLELILGVWEGAPRVVRIREYAGPAWCTLRPTPRYVPTAGYGDHVIGPDGRLDRARVQGQTRFDVPRTLVTRHREGAIRFASGALAPWSCAPGETVEVAEPEWLAITASDGELEIHVSSAGGWEPGASVAVFVRSPGGTIERQTIGEVDVHSTIALPAGARVMVEVDGRLVGRWWSFDES